MDPLQRLSALLLAALPLVCACGGGGAAASSKLQIAVIPKGTTHEYWKSIHAGALHAADELDIEIIWKGPQKEDDREAQVQVVEAFINRRVGGIVIAPLDDTALAVPCKEAVSQNIPVVIIDSDVKWDGRTSFVATDNYNGGVLGGQELARLLGGNGKVVMMRYLEGSASTTRREQGFLDAIAEHEGIELLSSNQYAGATNEGAYKTSENLLTSYGDEVDGIFCPNESAAFGMLRALQDEGKAGKIKLVGFDASTKLVQGLAAGEIDALIIQDPVAMGRIGVKTIVASIRGESVEKLIDTGVHVVTRANMEEPEMANLLSPDLSILDK